jgi:hypothetical protein
MLIYIKQQHKVIDLQVAMGVGGIVNWSAKGVASFMGWAEAPPQKILRTYPYPRPLPPKSTRHLKRMSRENRQIIYEIYDLQSNGFSLF